MSDRFALLSFLGKEGAFPLSRFVEVITPIGVSTSYPGTSVIKILDDAGNQLEITKEAFESLLHEHKSIHFQLWWSEAEDIYCNIRSIGEQLIIEIGLDGLDEQQETMVITCLRTLFFDFARTGNALGLVIDRYGGTAEYPWEEIVAGRTPMPGPHPDELILQKQVTEQLSLNFRESDHVFNIIIGKSYYS